MASGRGARARDLRNNKTSSILVRCRRDISYFVIITSSSTFMWYEFPQCWEEDEVEEELHLGETGREIAVARSRRSALLTSRSRYSSVRCSWFYRTVEVPLFLNSCFVSLQWSRDLDKLPSLLQKPLLLLSLFYFNLPKKTLKKAHFLRFIALLMLQTFFAELFLAFLDLVPPVKRHFLFFEKVFNNIKEAAKMCQAGKVFALYFEW